MTPTMGALGLTATRSGRSGTTTTLTRMGDRAVRNVWHNWRRALRFAALWKRTGSLDVTRSAAAMRCMPSLLHLYRVGGRITDTGLRIGGVDLDLRLGRRQWTCVGAIADIYRAGGSVIGGADDQYHIHLPGGARFEVAEIGLASAATTLAERFVRGQYASLDVTGKIVVDVGANIGDSAVYFARRGARHVYGYEPFSEVYEQARRNVCLNGCQPSVTLINAGVGDCDRRVAAIYDAEHSALGTIAAERSGPTGRELGGVVEQVRLLSFPTILQDVRARHPRTPIVCKIDCEGCEALLFAGEPAAAALRPVTQLYIEFHDGHPERLAARLRQLGFRATFRFSRWSSDRSLGDMFATR